MTTTIRTPLSHALPIGLAALALVVACGGATVDDLPGSAGAGGGNAGSSAAGSAGSAANAGSAGTGNAGSSGSAGSGNGGSGGNPNECTSPAQCPVPGTCQVCANGATACPFATCAGGKCGVQYPPCGDVMCKTASDCPQTDGLCQQCPDGTVICPSTECIGGQCVSSSGTCPSAPCAPQNANGIGMCPAFFGVKWNGSACVFVSGCSCEGVDCGNLYKSPDQCAAAHGSCGTAAPCAGKACGDICSNCKPGQTCPPIAEYCGENGVCGPAFPSCGGGDDPCAGKGCGDACNTKCDAPGCTSQPGQCNAAGQCTSGSPVCQNADCAPMNAAGVGGCAAFFGYAWNGQQCVGLGGCSCQGADCKKLYAGVDDCLNARAACACAGKHCGETCTCAGGACTKSFYYCDADFGGSCKPTPPICPL